MTGKIIYFLACTLVLAGITHIAIVLLIPSFGTRDAFAELSRQTELLEFTPLDPKAANSPLSDIDPFFAYGVCRFDLGESGMALRGPEIDTFWSATIFDGDGTVIYSLNSRTAIDHKLELILLNPVQILRLRELQPPEVEGAIVVESEVENGIVVLRVLRPDPTWDLKARNFLESVSCREYAPPTHVPTEEADAPAS